MRPRSILFIPRVHRLASEARLLIANEMEIITEIDDEDGRTEDDLAALRPDYVISFLSPRILRGPLLHFPNVNFHPAPPEYPGRGAASYALFENSPTFGATAHKMIRRVDAGEIYFVRRFAIDSGARCDQIFAKAEIVCLDLLRDYLKALRAGTLKPSSEIWKRAAGKRRDFEKWLVLDATKPEEFQKKIRAARHPRFKGPYVYVNGFRFSLDEDDLSKNPD